MRRHPRYRASLHQQMEADMLIYIVGSNTQTIMTRMCNFHRGLRTFRANHNIISVPVRSYEFQSVDKGLKHQYKGII